MEMNGIEYFFLKAKHVEELHPIMREQEKKRESKRKKERERGDTREGFFQGVKGGDKDFLVISLWRRRPSIVSALGGASDVDIIV